MRGERCLTLIASAMDSGSSPHARGTPSTSAASRSSFRFIPAYAGNARRPADAIADHPVHPRMRGERLSVAVRLNSSSGSSPHARGTRSRVPLAPFPVSVHPRMRGERKFRLCIRLSAAGSSPHARGTPSRGQLGPRCLRFIPACAGNADPGPSGMDQPPVHPRMRGERQGEIGGFPFVAGSSPHARGTPDRIRARPGGLRFIPACAGNAREHAPLSQHVAVHPRMRGERVAWGAILVVRAGSSPHARGTQLAAHVDGRLGRFIPACAGNASAGLR